MNLQEGQCSVPGLGGASGQGSPAPCSPAPPYLQRGQQGGQVGQLLLEGLVLLLILAGGGAGSLISRGGLPTSPGASGPGGPPSVHPPLPPPRAPNHLPSSCGGRLDALLPRVAEPCHSPLHGLQQQRFPLGQFVLGGTGCCRPGPPCRAASPHPPAPRGPSHAWCAGSLCSAACLGAAPARGPPSCIPLPESVTSSWGTCSLATPDPAPAGAGPGFPAGTLLETQRKSWDVRLNACLPAPRELCEGSGGRVLCPGHGHG